MTDKVKEMLKNVIEENAIKFKTATSDALYQKIGNRLKDEYKTVAKKMFNSLQEAAPVISSGEPTEAMPMDSTETVYTSSSASDKSEPVYPDPSDPFWQEYFDYDWKTPEPGQGSTFPDDDRYWPGGLKRAPYGDPNRPESLGPPARSDYPPGKAGDEAHQKAVEYYRERYRQWEEDKKEYKEWQRTRNKKPSKEKSPPGPSGPGSGSGAPPR